MLKNVTKAKERDGAASYSFSELEPHQNDVTLIPFL
jgi:hypothetical protein